MKNFILLLLISISLSGFSQVQGPIYVSGTQLDSTVNEFVIFVIVSNTMAFDACLDTNNGKINKKNKITDADGNVIKFKSFMALLQFIEGNGFTLTSKDFGVTGTVTLYYLFYSRTP